MTVSERLARNTTPRRGFVAVVALLFVPSCLWGGTFGSGKRPAYNRYTAQKRASKSYRPAELEPPERAARADRVVEMKVRAWADRDYRSKPHWQVHLRGKIAEVNRFLRVGFGVVLAVELETWDREGPAEDLSALVADLARHDPGTDVDFVLGLVGAPPKFTVSHDELGRASVLGKHMVVRDMNDAEESRNIEQVFSYLSRSDRHQLYLARKHHKETVVLLHEWAHTLGAIHEYQQGGIMRPTYDHTSAAFSEANAQLIELSLELRRLEAAKDTEATEEARAALVRHVERADWPDCEPEERAKLLALLGARDRAAPGPGGIVRVAPGPAAHDHSAQLPEAPEREAPRLAARDRAPRLVGASLAPKDASRFESAVGAAYANKLASAWNTIEPLVTRYPDNPDVQRLACRLARRRSAKPADREACDRAAALAPNDPAPLFARALAESDAPDRVLATLEEAAARIERTRGPAALWADLARAYLHFGAFTLAEAAARRAKGYDRWLARAILRQRRRMGLPRDAARFGIRPEDEPEYVRGFKEAYAGIAEGKMNRAASLARAGLRRHPGAPAYLAVLCGVELHSGRARKAMRFCTRALEAWDESMLAHFFAGQAAAELHRRDDAIRHLKRVIEIDPSDATSWTLLARLYQRAGDVRSLADLRSRYLKQFGRPLGR